MFKSNKHVIKTPEPSMASAYESELSVMKPERVEALIRGAIKKCKFKDQLKPRKIKSVSPDDRKRIDHMVKVTLNEAELGNVRTKPITKVIPEDTRIKNLEKDSWNLFKLNVKKKPFAVKVSILS